MHPDSTPPRRSRRLGPAERSAMLSAVIPGLGQWRAGRRARALLFFVPAGLGVAVVGVVAFSVWRNGASGLIEILVQPRWLWALVITNVVLALARLAATVDAWAAQPRRRTASAWTWGWRATAVVLTLAMLLPHVVVHAYGTEAIDLLETVFGDEPDVPLAEREAELLAQGFTEEDLGPVLTTTSTTTTAPTTTSTVPSTTTSSSTTSSTTTTTTLPDPTETLGERITVLLAGGDFGAGRNDLRTDVMMVASLDVATGTASLISVSRDLVQSPLPEAWAQTNTMVSVQQWHMDQLYAAQVAAAEEQGEEPPPQEPWVYCNCFFDRINWLYAVTSTWVRTFPDSPDPGMEALRQMLEVLLGIPIDHYVLVDFAGFVDLVDALGGVEVTVTERLDNAFSAAREGEDLVRIDVEPGVHLLDGSQALAYVRDRTNSNDAERMRRQRCMIRELAATADTATLIRTFPRIAEAIKSSTTTTLPVELLPTIIRVVTSLDFDDIGTLAIAEGRFSNGKNYMGLPIVDAPTVRAAVAGFLAGVSAGTTLGTAEDECAAP